MSSPQSSSGLSQSAGAYRVLARRYRPQSFDDLIGQEAMVRTLRHAFQSGRIAHAFVFTGVRGVGKTTTARLLARALNYESPDGEGVGPSLDIAVAGRHCQAIMESRHIDVLEMDAASHTGIADVREILESIRYRPVQARYKVYILDEVHMLSTQAFNGLLKTLEEPPAHVRFVFATTEPRRIPVTVLSRCQRFDLRRLAIDETVELLRSVALREEIGVGDGALALLARAAEGSARDALSLLDQAIAYADGSVSDDHVVAMLGLAGRLQTLDLLAAVMEGDAAGALAQLRARYDHGGAPEAVIADLIEMVHWLTRIRLIPAAADDPAIPHAERLRGHALAGALSVRALSLGWQILLRGLEEIRVAPLPFAAAEMTLIRLAHASALPSPEDVVARLVEAPAPSPSPSPSPSPPPAPSEAAGDVAGDVLRRVHEDPAVRTVLGRFPDARVRVRSTGEGASGEALS